jgi:hypothetical protein
MCGLFVGGADERPMNKNEEEAIMKKIAVLVFLGFWYWLLWHAAALRHCRMTAPGWIRRLCGSKEPVLTETVTASPEISEEGEEADRSEAPDDGSGTVGASVAQQNALSNAKSYLAFMPFSYQGLIEQLEYEGFTHEEAVYGADNCGADWMEQAVKKAKSYLDYSSFSREGLIEQLEYEGFTHEEAVYGADNSGLDGTQQVVEKAKSYLDYSSFPGRG